jgi:hypothetical protein
MRLKVKYRRLRTDEELHNFKKVCVLTCVEDA